MYMAQDVTLATLGKHVDTLVLQLTSVCETKRNETRDKLQGEINKLQIEINK